LIAASLVFLTPRGALLALGAAVPLLALAVAARRERRARSVLQLRAPSAQWWPAVATAAFAGLLGLAASQPVLRSTSAVETRTDAQVLFVLDNSRSMLASRALGARTRIVRARDDAIRLRDELGDIPAGVATLSDYVLPDLFPVPGQGVFDRTLREAAQVGNPPPASGAVQATNLGALGAVGTQSFFLSSVRRRVAIVLTDGESRPFDLRQLTRQLGSGPGVTPVFVHVWGEGERVFDPGGKAETAYHPDPASAASLTSIAQATGGKVFGENGLSGAAGAVRAAIGRGPTRPEGLAATTTALGPYVALAALLPLVYLFVGGGIRTFRASRRSQAPRAAVPLRAESEYARRGGSGVGSRSTLSRSRAP
jgi:hypothetical protein